MIEILIKYIQDHGFEVDVRPGYLIIRKMVKGQLLSISWGISKLHLRSALEECLYAEADHIMYRLDQAIAERYGCDLS